MASDAVNWESLSPRQKKDFVSNTPIPLVEKAVKELDFSTGGVCELSFKRENYVLSTENFSQVFAEVWKIIWIYWPKNYNEYWNFSF